MPAGCLAGIAPLPKARRFGRPSDSAGAATLRFSSAFVAPGFKELEQTSDSGIAMLISVAHPTSKPTAAQPLQAGDDAQGYRLFLP